MIESVSINQGKPLLLCEHHFLLNDMNVGSYYTGNLNSEFCIGAKCYITKLDNLPIVGVNNSITPYAPFRLTNTETDSLVFSDDQNDDDDKESNEKATDDGDGKITMVGKKDKYTAHRKTTSTLPNPMMSQYVFYSDESTKTEEVSSHGLNVKPPSPVCHMREMVIEPKRLTDIPVQLF